MKQGLRGYLFFVMAGVFFLWASPSWAQSSGSIEGTVKDPSGAAVPGATVDISYP